MASSQALDATALLDRAVEVAEVACADSGVPGLAVGVWRSGRTATAGLGFADLETGTPVLPNTRFRWCSVTKPLTATMIASLVADGLLELDAPVLEILPHLQLADTDTASRLTLRHLLTHSSGFECELNLDLSTLGTGDDALARAIDQYARLRQWTPPATAWGYCNTGYWLAAHLAEVVTGDTYERVMHDRVFEPAAMSSAGFEAESSSGSLATAYKRLDSDSSEREASPSREFPRSRRGSGGVIGSIDDLMLFAGAHLSSQPGPWADGVVSGLQQPQVDVGLGQRQLLGWFSSAVGDTWTVAHDGSWGGFETRLVLVPDAALGVGVLSNSPEGWRACVDVVDTVLERVHLVNNPPVPDSTLAPDRESLIGSYETGDGVVDIVTTDSGLAVCFADEPAIEYVPLTTDEFVDKNGDRLAFPLPGLVRVDERLGRRVNGARQ